MALRPTHSQLGQFLRSTATLRACPVGTGEPCPPPSAGDTGPGEEDSAWAIAVKHRTMTAALSCGWDAWARVGKGNTKSPPPSSKSLCKPVKSAPRQGAEDARLGRCLR